MEFKVDIFTKNTKEIQNHAQQLLDNNEHVQVSFFGVNHVVSEEECVVMRGDIN